MEQNLSKKVALLAKAQNITQKQIAEHCAISRITVHRFFTGKTQVRSSDFVKMLEFLGINILSLVENRLGSSQFFIPNASSGEPCL